MSQGHNDLAPTIAMQIDPTAVLERSTPVWERPWIVPTQNSVYEVDFCKQRARQISGALTTECFTPQGEWKQFRSCEIGYGGCLTFHWAPSAPHHMTVTSAVRPGAVRYLAQEVTD